MSGRERPRHRRCLGVLLSLGLLVSSGSASAYDRDEHVDVSNLALVMALKSARAACSETPCERAFTEQLGEASKLATDDAVQTTRSYGNLLALADFALGPSAYFEADEAGADILPHGVADIDWGQVARVWDSRTRYLQASHSNEGHFQDQALFNHWFWHRAALTAAARDQRLGLALVLEAYADHFLEDSFAPGHMLTNRTTAPDMVALRLHDLHNGEGMTFSVKPEAAAALCGLLNELDPVTVLNVPTTALTFVPDTVASLGSLLDDPKRCMELRGDGYLSEQPILAMFLATVAGRSILDVLTAYRTGDEVNSNSFAVYHWHWPPPSRVPRDEKSFPAAENAIGYFHFPKPAPRFLSRLPGRELLVFHTKWPTLVVSPHLETFSSGKSEDGRAGIDLEWLGSTTLASEKVFPTLQSPSWLVGLSVVVDDHYEAFGAGSRVVIPLRRLDLQFSLRSGVRYFDVSNERVQPYVGLDAETGFGLLFFKFGVVYDRYLDRRDRLQPGLAVNSGVSIVLPTSKLRGRSRPAPAAGGSN